MRRVKRPHLLEPQFLNETQRKSEVTHSKVVRRTEEHKKLPALDILPKWKLVFKTGLYIFIWWAWTGNFGVLKVT